MSARGIVLVVCVVFTGCVSLSAQVATRPPKGFSAAQVTRDEKECESYAKDQAKDKYDHYGACMVARGYAVNMDMSKLGWTIGVVQTRPHDPPTVTADMAVCDYRADNAKTSDVVLVTPEQEQSIAGQAHAGSGLVWDVYQTRPNASRMLVSCLHERGYAVTPWVRYNEPR